MPESGDLLPWNRGICRLERVRCPPRFLNADDLPARCTGFLELVKHIDVAVGAEIVANHASKECQLLDVMTPAEFREFIAIYGTVSRHRAHHFRSYLLRRLSRNRPCFPMSRLRRNSI